MVMLFDGPPTPCQHVAGPVRAVVSEDPGGKRDGRIVRAERREREDPAPAGRRVGPPRDPQCRGRSRWLLRLRRAGIDGPRRAVFPRP